MSSCAITKEVCSPTGVELCVAAHFTGESDDNLILAKSSVLEIYKILPGRKPLQLLSVHRLYGNIESMEVVKFSSGRDKLILSFRDAKISILEWNLATNDLGIVSMHYFEEISHKIQSGFESYNTPPTIRVDPQNRCAAILCFDRYLAILPFVQKDEDDFNPVIKQNRKVYPSFVITLPEMNEKITNVKDFVFLHGYFDPTILILHEPIQTWPGRVAVTGKKTCALTAISLNLSHSQQQNQHPVIWSVDSLPFDAFKLLPVTIGGALVMCINSVVFCDQSIKYQLLLNLFEQRTHRNYVIEQSEEIYFSLDASRFCFLDKQQLLVSLKGGELYILHLIVTDSRNMRRIEITKGGASVITSCMCLVDSQHLFLGSRLADSHLIQFQQKAAVKDLGILEPPTKIARPNDPNSLLFQDIDELDSAESFYSEINVDSQDNSDGVKNYSFVIRDTLLNIGPIADFDVSDQKSESPFSEQIVTASGYGKNSSLCVLQRGVRPNIFTSFKVPGCQNIWTLFSSKTGTAPPTKRKKPTTSSKTSNSKSNLHKRRRSQISSQSDDIFDEHVQVKDEPLEDSSFDSGHSLVLITTHKQTIVLHKTRADLTEISNRKEIAFIVNQPTRNSGNVHHRQFIVQIGSNWLRLLESAWVLVQEITFDKEITHSVILEDYILLSFSNHTEFQFVTYSESTGRLIQQEINFQNTTRQASKVSCVSLYYDGDTTSNFIPPATTTASSETVLTSSGTELPIIPNPTAATISVPKTETTTPKVESLEKKGLSLFPEGMEESDTGSDIFGDDFLGGSDDTKDSIFATPDIPTNISTNPEVAATDTEDVKIDIKREKQLYAIIGRENGTIEIHIVPLDSSAATIDTECVFHNEKFWRGGSLLWPESTKIVESTKKVNAANPNSIREVIVTRLIENEQPFLFARTAPGDVYVYRAFHYQSVLRFNRIQFPLILRQWNSFPFHLPSTTYQQLFVASDDQLKSVFLGGPEPYLFMIERGYLRVFPFQHLPDRDLSCFAPLSGGSFVYRVGKSMTVEAETEEEEEANQAIQEEIFIGELPTVDTHYNHNWLVQKLPLRKEQTPYTAHHLVYHQGSPQAHIAIVSHNVQETDAAMVQRDQCGGMARYRQQYEMRLYNPTHQNVANVNSNGIGKRWEMLDSYPFDENERVCSVTTGQLNYTDPSSNQTSLRWFILVGTSIGLNEDEPCKGRIVVFELIMAIRPSDQQTLPKIKFLIAKVEKGPVSAVGTIQGHLLFSVGPKIMMYSFESGKEIVGKAFCDTQLLVVSIKTCKNYILVADMYKSVSFLIWNRATRQLSLLSKDYGRLYPTECDFIYSEATLGLVVADRFKNLQVMNFDPKNIASRTDGKMLIPACEYHFGATVSRCRRVRMHYIPKPDNLQAEPTIDTVGVATVVESKPDPSVEDISKVKFADVMGSLDGNIAIVAPIDQDTYDLLLVVQSSLNTGIPHVGGLNPKSFRKYKPSEKQLRPPNIPILDFDLLLRYASLDIGYQREFAKLAGPNITVDHILYHLKALHLATSFC